MAQKITLLFFVSIVAIVIFSFRQNENANSYVSYYHQQLYSFQSAEKKLLEVINKSNLSTDSNFQDIKHAIQTTRNKLKGMDFWFRYLNPLSHKKINGPLPVEWETEVFEKFEKPYKREGAGLTLASQYLDEKQKNKIVLANLIQQSIDAVESYSHDSIVKELDSYNHFYLCNRLYLLNLATIYTTGFECPNSESIIPELRSMLIETNNIYTLFNESYSSASLTQNYLDLYNNTIQFANAQPDNFENFDHYTFIRDYINPLFTLNQQMILLYKVQSRSLVDYSLNKQATSIFSKSLYFGQNPKGIFNRVQDEATLIEIDKLGKLLFYDPILSGNNERSCASCHSPTQFFTDTFSATALAYDHHNFLPRNTPTLLNAQYNHLLMADGKHYTLQMQTKAVISNTEEMGCSENEMLQKILSCKEYKKAFTKLLKYTPQEKEITADHIASVITFYYSKYSKYYSPFDEAMNKQTSATENVQKGFNLFMSKAQCATCHFAPQFNGVKPPYIGSEFEVLGVPENINFTALSNDKGRYEINPSSETLNAFRTGTVRNSAYTKPYMHNGVFTTLEEVIDFYDAGGGAGRGFKIPNQTLSSDSLHLSIEEKKYLIAFIQSLNETVQFEEAPKELPLSINKQLNTRKVGGTY
jgi:cytochrome c peroxidase